MPLLYILSFSCIFLCAFEDQVSAQEEIPAQKAPLKSFASHGPYCGIYSIVSAASAFGKDVDPSRLWVPEVVSNQMGSNATNLLHGLRLIGLDGTCHKNLTWLDLSESKNPLILHYRSMTSAGEYDHWVTMLGVTSDGKYRLYDPPFPVVDADPALVLANWDGFALEVHEPGDPKFRPYIGMVIFVTGFACLVLLFSIIRNVVVAKSLLRVELLCIAILLIGASLLFHAQVRSGLFSNWMAVASLQGRYFGIDIQEIGIKDFDAARAKGSVLLDARREGDFKRGSVPGAINMPDNSTLPSREIILSKLSKDHEIIVFCQSERCPYSDRIARFLKFNGFKRVLIYRNGIREWGNSNDLSQCRTGACNCLVV